MDAIKELERRSPLAIYPNLTNYYDADVIDDENEFVSHAADAIKNREKINRIITQGYTSGDYCKITRFILGINTGFRDSDLRNIKVKDIFKPDGMIKDFFAVNEKKTLHTRKNPKPRIVYLNDTVKKALEFLVAVRGKRPQDYLFTADKQKHRRQYIQGFYIDKNGKTVAIKTSERFAADGTEYLEAYMETGDYRRYLVKLAKSLGLVEHCSTHCQRQTYGYWLRHTVSEWEKITDSIADDTDIAVLCNDFGHSDVRVTEKHYNRQDARIKKFRQLEMNLGKEAVDNFVDNFLQ